jgi:hypothetical protein
VEERGVADPDARAACAEERLAAETACELAAASRDLAERAVAELAALRRTAGTIAAEVTALEGQADRRAVKEAKVAARERYRAAARAADGPDALGQATGEWLHEIDALNRGIRLAAATLERTRRRAREIDERVRVASANADARRIAAEAAAAACVEARTRLADCEDAPQRVPPSGKGAPGIVRLVRGDRAALAAISRDLADAVGSEPAHYELLLVELAEAVVGRARDAGWLRFPERHPFWGQFSLAEARGLAGALARMGYRHDGANGWLEGRVPSSRELALALAHVGFDVRTVRALPSGEAIARLYEGVGVAGEEFLVSAAPTLSLDEVVTLAGRGAERLSELWDEWGRLRPLLVARSA